MRVVEASLANAKLSKSPHLSLKQIADSDEDDFSIVDDFSAVIVTARYPWYAQVKNVIDVILAAVLLVCLLPLILLSAIAVKWTSRGPAFYCQSRLGRDGRKFTLIKLRTMIVDAEDGTGPVWSKSEDPRITPVGLFLRKTQIDEFPQLLNVIMGQMSLIGPRPERPEIANGLELQIPYYRQRLKVKPGITGFAQLTLPADTDIESVRRKLVPDLYYVRNMNPWLDLRILIFTGVYFLYSICRACASYVLLPSHVAARKDLLAGLDQDLMEVDVTQAP